MKTKRAIVLSDSLPGNFTAYSAEDLRDEIVEMRDLVRALLRSAPEDFYMGVADVMKKLYVLEWLTEEAKFKDMTIPEE